MRAIAEYAMRGRTQAVTVAAVCAALPLLFWISAATVALTILRRGATEGLNLLLWAALPAIVWLWMHNDPTPFIVIVGTGLLALVLRATVSWPYTLVSGVILGIVVSSLIPVLLPELMAEAIKLSKQLLAEMATQIAIESGQQLDDKLDNIFAGILGSAHLFAMVGCLILGRWWQAALYNPGGFKTEFHQLILPKGMALPTMLLVVFGAGLHPIILGWSPILSVPFIIAGIALVHGIVGLRKLSGHWLVAFYLLVLFLGPYFYVLLMVMAFLDSIVNFRQRIQANLE